MTAARAEEAHGQPAGVVHEVPNWRARHARSLEISDLLVVLWAVVGAHVLRFGWSNAGVAGSSAQLSYYGLSVVLAVAWMLMLSVGGSRDRRTVGFGAEEYKAVVSASFRLFGAVAIAAFAFHMEIARGYVAIVFPVGTLALLISRWMWRQWLQMQRSHGRCQTRLVVVGHPTAAADLVLALRRDVMHTYDVVGACVPCGSSTYELDVIGVAVVGDIASAREGAESCNAEVIAVTTGEGVGGQQLRRLSWSLEGSGIEMVVAPSLVDVAGPRVHVRPVAGLPLLHLEEPQLRGAARVTKRVFDLLSSLLGLVVLSPLLFACALLVKMTSPGPMFFRQDRVGINGQTFRIIKFRTMRADAVDHLAAVMEDSGGIRPLFKLKHDPRVTPLGSVLRRYSLDELPQLFNVVTGAMSVVGPRPQIQAEVEHWAADHHRRLLVRPGITGLWQVSGRSELSWEDSVRLDLYYVENWSLTADLVIVLKTLRTVVEAAGAY